MIFYYIDLEFNQTHSKRKKSIFFAPNCLFPINHAIFYTKITGATVIAPFFCTKKEIIFL